MFYSENVALSQYTCPNSDKKMVTRSLNSGMLGQEEDPKKAEERERSRSREKKAPRMWEREEIINIG